MTRIIDRLAGEDWGSIALAALAVVAGLGLWAGVATWAGRWVAEQAFQTDVVIVRRIPATASPIEFLPAQMVADCEAEADRASVAALDGLRITTTHAECETIEEKLEISG